jgi:hypothetical protein
MALPETTETAMVSLAARVAPSRNAVESRCSK